MKTKFNLSNECIQELNEYHQNNMKIFDYYYENDKNYETEINLNQ